LVQESKPNSSNAPTRKEFQWVGQVLIKERVHYAVGKIRNLRAFLRAFRFQGSGGPQIPAGTFRLIAVFE